jgi:HAD superfamily hydrolase (TIGR01490 family)
VLGVSQNTFTDSGLQSTDPNQLNTASVQGKAAFYDVDGTLMGANVLHPYAYYALSVPSLTGKISRIAKLGASLPLYAWADRKGRKFFNDLFYKNYKGISEDRLIVIGQEMFDTFLRSRIYSDMVALMKQSKAEGFRQVLITGAVSPLIEPLAHHLEVDDWVANRLEIDSVGLATGELIPPVLAGPEKSTWIKQYAQTHNLDLHQCHAYADSASDIPMLCTVGHPVAVNPDTQLKATADAHQWPIIWAK